MTSSASIGWTSFYEAIADALLQYSHNRSPLVEAVSEIAGRRQELPFAINDQFPDGSTGPLRDICPFTTIGLFNRSLRDDNRSAIAGELAQFLRVPNQVPDFSTNDDGIPLLNNQRSWFFHYERLRQPGHIDTLWRVFADAMALADGNDQLAFVRSYDRAQSQPLVRYNLTMGLYWVRPWYYPPLDNNCRNYITNRLQVAIPRNVPTGAEYLKLRDYLTERFQEGDLPVCSFPELSWAAYQRSPVLPPQRASEPAPKPEPRTPQPISNTPIYPIFNILADGSFLDLSTLEAMLQRLVTKNNIILQGPPGTGKTWLAKRLAYALIGRKDDQRVRPMQFHPNLSYEDFVRGWRPQGDGRLSLVDGPFLQMVEQARADEGSRYVMVIEEINRGNPASIFGEMLTLLEADKRNRDEALALAYPRESNERVHIPPNVYVIGTMNTADRSIAMVDLALRRRFAFFDLEPMIKERWREWVGEQCSIDGTFLDLVAQRINSLNEDIATDRNLGRQFRIGHSFVTPAPGTSIEDPDEWFEQIVETDIVPLLREYWFDNPDRVAEARSKLLANA